MPTWLLFVILLIVIAIIIWILVSGNPEEEKPTPKAAEVTPVVETVIEDSIEETVEEVIEDPVTHDEAAVEPEEVIEMIEPDDLKKIEGIGPKISGILAEKGILTFAQLAKHTEDDLKAILDEANIRIANPSTWAEQAMLAADGNWEGLEALQDQLKGGRRV